MAALGVSLYGVQGFRYSAAVDLGKLAEDQGFDGVFIAESFVNDGMATVQAIAMRTQRITVGAGIANVYLRHPVTLGAGAVAIDELSGGRLLLGLGVNHASMVTLPVYAKMFRGCGFQADVESFQQAMERGRRETASAAISDRLLDAVCLVGPLSRCQERLAAFRDVGITYPILGCQPVHEAYADGARRIVQAFGGNGK